MTRSELDIQRRIIKRKGIFKNFRLHTLRHEAWHYANNPNNVKDLYKDSNEAFEVKFAELIVQDCLDHIDYVGCEESDSIALKHNIKTWLKWD